MLTVLKKPEKDEQCLKNRMRCFDLLFIAALVPFFLKLASAWHRIGDLITACSVESTNEQFILLSCRYLWHVPLTFITSKSESAQRFLLKTKTGDLLGEIARLMQEGTIEMCRI